MRSLRARLAVVWALSLAASLALAALMTQLYARSSSLTVARAEDEASRACEQVRDAWRYYDGGWTGPAPTAGDSGLRSDLRAVLALALDGSAVHGGLWTPQDGLLASWPADVAALPATSLWRPVAASASEQDHDTVQQANDAGDAVAVAACPLPGPIAGLVAWTSRRAPSASGLTELRAGLAVLLALLLAIAGWLSWLVVSWSRQVRRIEFALAGHAQAGGLPRVASTGERELDRIVAALNHASVRLDVAQRDAGALAARIAGAERMAALGRVAAGVAHEIRNPIAAMRLRAENALAGDDARRRSALQTILGQIARLDRLLAELLAMTQGRAPAIEAVELAAFLAAVRGDHEDAARAAAIALEVEAAAGVVARLDPAMIGRALANLVQNAIRATAPGGRIVLAGTLDPACATLRLTVSDTGSGVADALRATLFEPFVTGRADGTGLGLAISRELAAAHGGTLALLDGAPGAGARFEIALPGQDRR